jgi:hypothetical protein
MEINHVNGVKDDNRLANLEVVTHTQNMRHARTTGLMPPPPGRSGPRESTGCRRHGFDQWRLRSSGDGGYCLTCQRLRMQAVRARPPHVKEVQR